MRLVALTAAVFLTAIIFFAGEPSVNAQSQNNQKVGNEKTIRKLKKHKPKIVTIKPGDNLVKIAKTHKSSFQRIFYANKEIESPDLIFPGQRLLIPAPNQKLKERPLSSALTSNTEPSKSAKISVAKSYHPHKALIPASSVGSGVWDKLAACEAGGNWSINTGNGYYGGLQFTLSSWRATGGSGYPNQASREEQITRGKILQSRQGWGAWPACTAKLGIR